MKKEQFEQILQQRINKLQSLVDNKGTEYTIGEDNQFHNFDKAAIMSEQTPEQVLWSYVLKHLVSVKDMIDSGDPQNSKVIDEKIGDIICYFALLEGLMIRRNKEKQEKVESDNNTVTMRVLSDEKYHEMMDLPPEKRIREPSGDDLNDKIDGILIGFGHSFARREGWIDLITTRAAELEIRNLIDEQLNK